MLDGIVHGEEALKKLNKQIGIMKSSSTKSLIGYED